MREAEGTFLRQKKGLGYAARVSLRVDPHTHHSSISVACYGRGWTAQGSVEEVPAKGYDPWKAGAVAGIRFALRAAAVEKGSVTVTRIVGMVSDTNPTIVGAAAIDGFWKALGYTRPGRTNWNTSRPWPWQAGNSQRMRSPTLGKRLKNSADDFGMCSRTIGTGHACDHRALPRSFLHSPRHFPSYDEPPMAQSPVSVPLRQAIVRCKVQRRSGRHRNAPAA